MAITDGLMQTEAYISQLRATDEVFGTRKLEAYLVAYGRDTKPKSPIVTPTPGLVDPAQHVDARKVARQHQLFEEQVAFVLGHELGHHYLGHTGCATGAKPDIFSQGFRVLNKVVPVFNQPNEVAADSTGIDDVIAAGARHPGYRWTEQGALLTLDFFAHLKHSSNALGPFAAVLSSHPDPELRRDPLLREATRFRATGQWYQQPQLPQLPLPYPQ
jgi:hypothetical protein